MAIPRGAAQSQMAGAFVAQWFQDAKDTGDMHSSKAINTSLGSDLQWDTQQSPMHQSSIAG